MCHPQMPKLPYKNVATLLFLKCYRDDRPQHMRAVATPSPCLIRQNVEKKVSHLLLLQQMSPCNWWMLVKKNPESRKKVFVVSFRRLTWTWCFLMIQWKGKIFWPLKSLLTMLDLFMSHHHFLTAAHRETAARHSLWAVPCVWLYAPLSWSLTPLESHLKCSCVQRFLWRSQSWIAKQFSTSVENNRRVSCHF